MVENSVEKESTIRNRDGILVDWSAEINLTNGTPKIEFSSPECGHYANLDLPDFGSVLTVGDSIPFEIGCEEATFDLESSDGRTVSIVDNEIQVFIIWNCGRTGFDIRHY